jgi:hypothetical protein
MELMDFLDVLTPISCDYKKLIPPYIGSRLGGRTLCLNRTKADRCSNPLRFTHEPPYVEVYVFYPTYGVLIRDTETGMRSIMTR